MSLRARRKVQTRTAILMGARQVLYRKEYSVITMEEIAEVAGIAVGTLYNYFKSKNDLLLTLIAEIDSEYLAEGEEIIRSDAELGTRLTDLMLLASEYSVKQINKSAWRHIIAITLSDSNVELGKGYSTATENHMSLVAQLMGDAKSTGELKPGVCPDLAAFVVFSMKSKMFLDFISDETMNVEEHRTMIAKGVRYFLQGIQISSDEVCIECKGTAALTGINAVDG